MIILETPKDKSLERRAVGRFTSITTTEAIEMPRMSAVDYLIKDFGEVAAGLEVKTRKETPQVVMGYGGLILKNRKYLELKQIGELLNLPMYVLFAFENSEGDLLLLNVNSITNPEPRDPPKRKNYRGLATDEELVLFVDWELLEPVSSRWTSAAT